MKTLTPKMLTGVVALGLASWSVSETLAAGPPGYPHYHHHPGYVVVNSYVAPTTYAAYYTADASNPAPGASIRLVNPAANRVALRYVLDGGSVQSLPAGYQVEINRVSVIEFDRGGSAGRARYTLWDGTYKFLPTSGVWDLYRQAVETAAPQLSYAASNPLPAN
jgi:hypothetical protein